MLRSKTENSRSRTSRKSSIAADDSPGGPQESAEQIELSSSQIDKASAAPDRAGPAVNDNVGHSDNIASLIGFQSARRSASQNCLYSGDKLLWVEWFWEVIVRSGLQTNDAVDGIAACRQHQDRNCEAFRNRRRSSKPLIRATLHRELPAGNFPE